MALYTPSYAVTAPAPAPRPSPFSTYTPPASQVTGDMTAQGQAAGDSAARAADASSQWNAAHPAPAVNSNGFNANGDFVGYGSNDGGGSGNVPVPAGEFNANGDSAGYGNNDGVNFGHVPVPDGEFNANGDFVGYGSNDGINFGHVPSATQAQWPTAQTPAVSSPAAVSAQPAAAGSSSSFQMPTYAPLQGMDLTLPGAAEQFYTDNQGSYKSLYGAPFVSNALASYQANGAPNGSGVIGAQQAGYATGQANGVASLGAQRGGLAAIGQAGSSAGAAYAGAQNYSNAQSGDAWSAILAGLTNTQNAQTATGNMQLGNSAKVAGDAQQMIAQETQALNAARASGQISEADYNANLARIRSSASGAVGQQTRNYGDTAQSRTGALSSADQALAQLFGQDSAATNEQRQAIGRINTQGDKAFNLGAANLQDLMGSKSDALGLERANYDRFQAARPELQNDAGLGGYYDNAIRRSTEGINQALGARGAYGSSAADDQIKEGIVNLNAERANREADYNLKRSAENRAWEDTSGGLVKSLTGDTLGYDTLTSGALSDLLKNKQGYDTASLNASGDLGKLRLGYNQAESNASQEKGKLGLGYDTLLGDISNNLSRNQLGFDTLQTNAVNDQEANRLGNATLGVNAAHGLSSTGLGYDTLNSNNVNQYADNQLGFATAGNTAANNLASSKYNFANLNADTVNKAQSNQFDYSKLTQDALDSITKNQLGYDTLGANTLDSVTKNQLGYDKLGLDTTLGMGGLAQTQDQIDIANRSGQLNAATAAQNAQRNRGNDAIANQTSLANSLSSIMGDDYNKMSATDLDLLMQELGMDTGTASEGYAQATRAANATKQDDQANSDRLSAALKLLTAAKG